MAIALIGAVVATLLDAVLLALALGGLAALRSDPRAGVLLFIWFAGALVLGLRRPVRAKAGTKRTADPALLLALFVLPLAATPLAAWSERLGVWLLPGGAIRAWAGVLLVALGLALRIAAMSRLGSRFDPTVAILPDHVLETGGPYALIRHPGYSGAWLAALGGALAFDGGFGLVAVLLMAAALGLRARNEERVLEAHFGETWRVYRGRTGAFWPRLH